MATQQKKLETFIRQQVASAQLAGHPVTLLVLRTAAGAKVDSWGGCPETDDEIGHVARQAVLTAEDDAEHKKTRQTYYLFAYAHDASDYLGRKRITIEPIADPEAEEVEAAQATGTPHAWMAQAQRHKEREHQITNDAVRMALDSMQATNSRLMEHNAALQHSQIAAAEMHASALEKVAEATLARAEVQAAQIAAENTDAALKGRLMDEIIKMLPMVAPMVMERLAAKGEPAKQIEAPKAEAPKDATADTYLASLKSLPEVERIRIIHELLPDDVKAEAASGDTEAASSTES